ncbi:hypothetical protein Lal_00035533 [Lupinus albus]|nr:hypothetical protein Lal_00035533 [Lupinus albus]
MKRTITLKDEFPCRRVLAQARKSRLFKISDPTLSLKPGILAQARISQCQQPQIAISRPGETTLAQARILQYSPGFHPPRNYNGVFLACFASYLHIHNALFAELSSYQSSDPRLSERFSPERERITWEGEILDYTGRFSPEREFPRLGEKWQTGVVDTVFVFHLLPPPNSVLLLPPWKARSFVLNSFGNASQLSLRRDYSPSSEPTLAQARILQYSPGFHPPREGNSCADKLASSGITSKRNSTWKSLPSFISIAYNKNRSDPLAQARDSRSSENLTVPIGYLSLKRGILAQARISQCQQPQLAISRPGEATLAQERIFQYSPGFHPLR